MGFFSKSKKVTGVCEECQRACRKRFQDRLDLITESRQHIDAGSKVADQDWVDGALWNQQLENARKAADRFELYNDAMVRARAAENVYNPDQTAECTTNLTREMGQLKKDLNLPPQSNYLSEADFRDDKSGFRAALYRSESNGKYVLAFRGTDPESLADWRTNIDNGRGADTDQYKEAVSLVRKLKGVRPPLDFDITGHSKGGGLATEAGMAAPGTQVYTFNSAGLSVASLNRTGALNFADITSRTQAFHTAGDFLTMMQEEDDPDQQIANAKYLRKQLESGYLKIKKLDSTEPRSGDSTPPSLMTFEVQKKAFLTELDDLIKNAEEMKKNGACFDLFPKAVGQSHTVGASSLQNPDSLAALLRHPMDDKLWWGIGGHGMVHDLEAAKEDDQAELRRFLASPPPSPKNAITTPETLLIIK